MAFPVELLNQQLDDMFQAKQHMAWNHVADQMRNRNAPPSYAESSTPSSRTQMNPASSLPNLLSGALGGLGPLGMAAGGVMHGISSLINSNSQRDINQANLDAKAKQFDKMLGMGMNPFTGAQLGMNVRGLGNTATGLTPGVENPFR